MSVSFAATSLLIIVLLCISIVSSTPSTTLGPLASVSISDELAYSTARSCAAGCLVYSGQYACGFGLYQDDVGMAIGCGCHSINACFCSTGLQSSATSYLSSCISDACSDLGDVNADIDSMLALYGGYCSTANVAVASTAKTTATPSGGTGSGDTSMTEPATTGGQASASTALETGGVTSATTTPAATGDDKGLKESDIIALAASLGVGIPSLLIAAVTLCVQLRRRKANQHAVIPNAGSNADLLHRHDHPTQPLSQNSRYY